MKSMIWPVNSPDLNPIESLKNGKREGNYYRHDKSTCVHGTQRHGQGTVRI